MIEIELNLNIPGDIIDRITDREAERSEYENNSTRWYSYLENDPNGETVISTVVVKNSDKRIKGLPTMYYKKISITRLDGTVMLRDVAFNDYGTYLVNWGAEIHKSENPGGMVCSEGSDDWYIAKKSTLHFYENDVLNPQFLADTEFRYSAFDCTTDILAYLREYRSNPKIELISKLLGCKYAVMKSIVKLAGKDKKFIRYLYEHSAEIRRNEYTSTEIIAAYRHKTPLAAERDYAYLMKRLRYGTPTETLIREYLKASDLKYRLKLQTYITEAGIESYIDYVKAIHGLGLDYGAPKNHMPHDFRHWHDLRINEYAEKQAAEDAALREALNNEFARTAQRYESLELYGQKYNVIIARTPAELVKEGAVLHHCVGKMGYAEKMAKGSTIIMFVRKSEQPNLSYVTMEFSPKDKRVLQLYGDHDDSPCSEVKEFVRECWQPQAVKVMKRLERRGGANGLAV